MCLSALVTVVVNAMECKAQNPQAELSWGSSCPTVIQNMNWGSPGTYEMWIGVKNLTANDVNAGAEVHLVYGPPIADAWRFDNGGCQSPGYVQMTNDANSKGCPALLGARPLTLTNITYDPVAQKMDILLAVVYDAVTPTPGVTYTLWNIFFDHQYSIFGTNDPNYCFNAGKPMCLTIADPSYPSYLISDSGSNLPFTFAKPSDATASWNYGCVPVATLPATWGRIKASYR